jgi:hypothetical protein
MSETLTFPIDSEVEPGQLISVMRDEMQRRGATVTGGSNRGTFVVPLPDQNTVDGTYRTEDGSIVVDIQHYPKSISISRIHSLMTDAILDAEAQVGSKRAQKPGS